SFRSAVQSRVPARSVHSWLQSLDKEAPAKLGPAFLCLRHNISLRRLSTVGGIAAAVAFASSSFGHGSILQAQEVTDVAVTDGGPSKDNLVESDEEFSPALFWLRRLWVPLMLVMTISMGWRYPLSLSINLLFLLWSTKPTPSSIYMWVEQKRLQAAARAQGLSRLKVQLSNATMMTHVEVQDYGFACIARVSSLSQKMLVIGVLGEWWVLYSCSSSISGFNIGSWFPISPADQW
ncbi:hypothetical protein GOP47_0010406, partial [Adiantum capillus-veneris]